MAKKLSTPAPLFPWDGGFDLDDLAKLTHKAHHPDLYRAAFTTEKGESTVPKAFAKPSAAFKQKRNPHFTFIDLFAGIGGFRVAGQNVGGSCVFTSEWDKYARRAYFMNFGQVPFGDITKFTENEGSLRSIPKHDVLCGGFPCQAFSISGKQEGFKDPRGTLFFEIYKIAKQHRPAVLFLENVKNFARHDNGNTFKTIRHHLEKKMAQETKDTDKGPVSYRVSSAVMNASDFGASTKRERIYIVAVREDLVDDEFKWSAWLELFQRLPNNRNFPKKFLWEDIQPNNTIERNLLEKLTLVRLDFRPKLTETRDDIKPKNAEVEEATKPIRIGVMGKGGQGERIYSTNGHAITFSAYGGGAASKTGAYYIDGIVRKLTPTECASSMGFHGMDVSTGDVPLLQRYKQFGNSVVVNVVEAIFKEINDFWLKKKHSLQEKKKEEGPAIKTRQEKQGGATAPNTGDESNDKRGDRFATELAKEICSDGSIAKQFSTLAAKIRGLKNLPAFKVWDVTRGASKGDIVVPISENERPLVIAVFSASKANFNHLERAWPEKYAAQLNWNDEFTELISLFTGKSSPSNKNASFLKRNETPRSERAVWDNFTISAQKKIIDGLTKTRRQMLTKAFCGSGKAKTSPTGITYNDQVDIIAFHDRGGSDLEAKWSLCLPSHILEGVMAGEIMVRRSGTVISLGNSVTLQRYGGGAGKGDTSQKSQLQIKIKPRQLLKESIDWEKYDKMSPDLTFSYSDDEGSGLNLIKSHAAKRGLTAELALIDAINDDNPDCEWIVKEVADQNGYGNYKARKPDNKEKPDVILHQNTGAFLAAHGISMKTYKANISFGQASRGTVETYTKDLSFTDEVADTLRDFAVEDAEGERTMLNNAPKNKQEMLLSFFTRYQRQVISHILKGKEHAPLKADWMLFHEASDEGWVNRVGNTNFWHLYPMAMVIDSCCSVTPSITKAGNLTLGLGLTLQRKGGDGGAKTANDLQFKINPRMIHEALQKS